MAWRGVGLVAALLAGPAGGADQFTEEEQGTVKEDLGQYTREGSVLYKVLWRPVQCDGPSRDGDDITMEMEYWGQDRAGREVEMQHALTTKLGQGQAIRSPAGEGLLGMCLGERRRLLIPDRQLRNKYQEILPGILDTVDTFLEVELTGINAMTWHRHSSGLLVAMLEPVEDEYCNRTVARGDILAVEYEGSLEDGTVFDSSTIRGAPFGPFVHGRGQIIEGYTEALAGRCLGERWRMVVPPHLAYGEEGREEGIPGGATLIFDVRLVLLNSVHWSEEVRGRKVLGWRSLYTPEVCEEMVGWEDRLFMHYAATREDGSRFGSLVDGHPPYGPFSLAGDGTFVPALDHALPGMCLGERREVMVPPRMGWAGRSSHADTITVELVVVSINGAEVEQQPKAARGEL